MMVEIKAMGKVLVAAKVENLQDLFNAEKGLLPAEQVRCRHPASDTPAGMSDATR